MASALLAPLSALTGPALGTVLRHSAAAVTADTVVLLPPPLVFRADRYWSAVVGHALPAGAWNRPADAGDRTAAHPWTVTGAWTVHAVWAVLAAAVAVISVRRRDH